MQKDLHADGQGDVMEPAVERGSLVAEILENTTDGVFMLDYEWRFIYLNAHARKQISNGQDGELLGTVVWDRYPAAAELPFWENYHRTMNERVPTQFMSYYPEPINAWFEVHSYPTQQGISVFFRNVTKQRSEEERLLLLEQAVASSPMGITIAEYRREEDCPIIYVNPSFEALTGYTKEEVLGHIEADRLLFQIARRLYAAAGPGDTVSRLGGDEFALILTDWCDQGRLHKQMDRLLHEIRKPLSHGNHELIVTGSGGVAIYPQDAEDADSLLQMADQSMYWIKRCGKNSFRLYSPELRVNDNEPLDVAVGFRKALSNDEFRLHYQPRVSAHTERIVGFEALIRWQHPTRGLLYPAQFIRVAEDTGLINEIGAWVLKHALEQCAAWRDEGLEPVCMSLNVSPAQIRDPGFPAMVAEALEKSGVPASVLELELTESSLIDNAELADASLRALKRLGVRVAIDDFGAGFSGLQYLSRFPVDTLKIDHTFTRGIASNETAATICRSILQLGRALGLTTVAEGVETTEQAALLREWACSELQGFMFSRPLPEEDARQWLKKESGSTPDA